MEDYNAEPVLYCSKCYSLKIVHEDAIHSDCCGKCGCSDLQTSSIEEWESLFKNRYGHKFVEENHDIRKSPIFLLTTEKLKMKVYNSPDWRDICYSLYPTFPEGLSKSDSVILLFAKLYQENRLDDLKLELTKRSNKYGREEQSKRG